MQDIEKLEHLKQVIDSGFMPGAGYFEIAYAVEKMVDRWDSLNSHSLAEINGAIAYLNAVKAALEDIILDSGIHIEDEFKKMCPPLPNRYFVSKK